MSYYEDAVKQLDSILSKNGNENIKTLYSKELKSIFLKIYAINFISNRVEFSELFKSNYYSVSFSCLLESFSLILNNYPRGSALVLRSSLENFIKYIIDQYDSIDEPKYLVNDRSYTENKKTLEVVINNECNTSFKEMGHSLNSKMETQYRKLSALSHSLIPESKNNTIQYLSQIDNINIDNLNIVIEKFVNITDNIFSFCIILCSFSLKEWETDTLEKIFRLAFGKNKTKKVLNLVKN